MNIENAMSYGSDNCYICNEAGAPIIFWPQEISGDAVGAWHGYLKVDRDRWPLRRLGRPERSRHTNIIACPTHWEEIHAIWVALAREEVELDRAFYSYLERVEKF